MSYECEKCENRFECEKCEKHTSGACPFSVFEDVDVAVPVSVRAFADVGNVAFRCLGATIIPESSGKSFCGCGCDKFIISQKMRIDIPVMYGAEADVGEGHIHFEEPKSHSDCGC